MATQPTPLTLELTPGEALLLLGLAAIGTAMMNSGRDSILAAAENCTVVHTLYSTGKVTDADYAGLRKKCMAVADAAGATLLTEREGDDA